MRTGKEPKFLQYQQPDQWRARRGGKRISNLLGLALFLVLAHLLSQLPGPIWNQLQVKEIVSSSLRTWRVKDKAKAKAQFQNQLSKRELPEDILQSCTFMQDRLEFSIECWWDRGIELVGYGEITRLELYVYRSIDVSSGEVYDVDVSD